MPAAYTCDSVIDYLQRESNRIGPTIYTRAFARSPWVRLVKRGTFPDEMGVTIRALTYERSAPTEANTTWTALVTDEDPFTTAAGGACIPDATKIAVGNVLRNYSLCRRVLEGPDFCVENIRFAFQLRDQLSAIMDILTNWTMLEWEIRNRHEYLKHVKWKVVAGPMTTTTTTSADCSPASSTYTAACPTSILTQGMLNTWKMKLLRDGAIESALGMEDGSPVLTLITDGETSDDLIFRNADIRQDLRWGKPNELLAPIGVSRSYRGFYHVIDPYPIRGVCAGGTFTEIAPFSNASGLSKGTAQQVNPAWEGAYHMYSFVFDPEVFHQLIAKPISSPAPGFSFNPLNYMGDWQLKNIIDRECNPDGTIVFHRGHLMSASKPVHPERGVAFLHLRCDPPLNIVTNCS